MCPVDNAKFAGDLVKIDLEDKVDVLLPDRAIKLPTATSSALRHLEATETEKLIFKKDCKTAVIAILQKLLERSPIKYKMCRAASSISPSNMVSEKKRRSIQGFTYICDKLYDHGFLPTADADRAKEQYENFIVREGSLHREEFLAFDADNDRLDTFLSKFFQAKPDYDKCWLVMIFVMTMSHGQSNIERGQQLINDIIEQFFSTT